ncbi:S-adenosyl-L-methionine-dependent methyltransferase [Apiosordaria backusii]|uniref:S-adenosyl-L-methionine-dependent methyltransferase n=1 Tax=Apiosordaria backusii TaxID=314023 RepID=A0AA40BLV9_9PEZI|nr:S-adenosyl-L-methionine-dependent methyltransferase [Apiosordaria backusii]
MLASPLTTQPPPSGVAVMTTPPLPPPPKKPCDIVAAAEALLEDAKRLSATIDQGDDNVPLRHRIAQAARTIAVEASHPIDAVKSEWVTAADIAVWSLLMSWKAFDLIPLSSPGYITFSDLALTLNADETLITRLITHLIATTKLLPGPIPNSVSHSRLSPLYISTNPVSDLAAIAVGNAIKPFFQWPAYFSHYGRRESPGQTHTPFSFAWGHPELPPWEVKALNPDYSAAFKRSMQAKNIFGGNIPLVGEGALYDISWVGSKRTTAAKDGRGLRAKIVDVGGGMGQLLKELLGKVDGLAAQECVLQDRPDVIDAVERLKDGKLEGVRIMSHDFHEAQVVKGAWVYVLRRILLDYSDALAVNILKQLADALPEEDPEARVLIVEPKRFEGVIPPQNTYVDLVMFNLGGKLRNEKMFRDLVAKAGLRVVGYHVRADDPHCVVECAKA